MNLFHLAINTHDIESSIEDYIQRLGVEPEIVVEGEYALWRTESLNVSVRKDTSLPSGLIRHVGWEDESAVQFSSEKDVNGIEWEHFSAAQQQDEIVQLWPNASVREN